MSSDLGGTGSYFQESGEEAFIFRDLGRAVKK